MWPVFNRRNTDGEQGLRVWPLFGSYSKSNGSSYKFAFWPLCNEFFDKPADKLTRFTLPAYYYRRVGDDFKRIVPGLLYQEKEGPRQLTLSPMWFSGKSGKSNWEARQFLQEMG